MKKQLSERGNTLWVFIKHFGRVSKEFVITIFFSLVPILISSVVAASWSSIAFTEAFIDSFESGEAFLYTAAFLAPYIVNRLKEGTKNIWKEFCFYLFLGSLTTGAYIFVNLRIESLLGIEMKISPLTMDKASLFVVFATLIVWYYSIWPNHLETLGSNPSKKNEEEIEEMNENITNKLGG
ncbi:hypothetical protein AB4499_18875 [Vibrio cyclitrophicus]